MERKESSQRIDLGRIYHGYFVQSLRFNYNKGEYKVKIRNALMKMIDPKISHFEGG